MPCSTDDRSHRKYYERLTPIETLETVTTTGNSTTEGITVDGSIYTDGYFIGDASKITNFQYFTFMDLDDVVTNGNTTTRGALFNGDLEASGYFIGDASKITNFQYFTFMDLDDVVTNGNTTNRGAYFDGDLEASGYFIGDATYITNLPYVTGPNGLTLDDVVVNGNTVTVSGAYFDGDLEASGYLLGDATYITNLPYMTGPNAISLDDVVVSGNTVTVSGAYFGGDLEASGYLIGDGTYITNAIDQTLDFNDIVTTNNVSSVGAVFGGDVTASGFLIGDGSLVTNLPINTLQEVTTSGSSTNRFITFTNGVTSFEAIGNVVVTGNVTCSKLIGSGEFLGGVANAYELSVLSSSISSVENKKIITNTSGLTDVTKGDLLTSTTNGVLGKLSIGSNGQLLLADTTTSLPKWETVTNILDIGSRTNDLENEFIFNNFPNLSSLTTGDILYGYDANDLRKLARETTADNTFLTTGDYGTGYGRLLRIDALDGNVMWLHPSNYDTNVGNEPIFTSGTSGTLNYITIELSTNKIESSRNGRIPIATSAPASELLFSLRFNDTMFYSEEGRSYSGTGNTKHPSGIKWKLYTYGDIYANYIHGDGSKLVFPQFPSVPFGSTLNPSGAPQLGKAGQLLVFSDKRRKSKIQAMSTTLNTLSKLLPKIYDKQGKRESGFIAQEMYYDVKEMRHIVWTDRDATPNDHAPEPDYSDWGKRHACLRYLHFIAYVVRSIQEIRERIERLKK